MMAGTSVWLNTFFNCIPSIRRGDTEKTFRVETSYRSRKHEAQALLADRFEVEPEWAEDDYVDFALEFAKRRRVDVFLPGRKVETIARRLGDFASIGVRVVLAADAATLAILANKASFYGELGAGSVPVPRYAVASSPDEFSNAIASLERDVPVVCFKPTVGIYGVGFGIVANEANRGLITGVDPHLLTTRERAVATLAKTGAFARQIVLEYLAGEECSVDCLAHEGRLIRSVVRLKHRDGARTLEAIPEVEEHSAWITERFRLSGLFNVQFKRHHGLWYVLEVNSRMSGGIGMSCLSGVEFPYWAVRYALGSVREELIPQPVTGLRVTEISQAMVLGHV